MAGRFLALEVTLIPPMRDLIGRFATANKAVTGSGRRLMLVEEGRRLVHLTKQEAPGGASGTIGEQVRGESFVAGGKAGYRIIVGRIGRFHVEGTGLYGPRHALIRPRHARALRFDPGGGVIYRAWVRGVRKNAFPRRAYRSWLPGAKRAVRKWAKGWTRTAGAR